MKTENKQLGFVLFAALLVVVAASVTFLGVGELVARVNAAESIDTTDALTTATEETAAPETEASKINTIKFYGIKDRFGYVGDSFDYMAGVFATTTYGGRVEVKVNTSEVNCNKVGEYAIEYYAYDKNGDKVSEIATVTIYSSDTVRMDIDPMLQLPEMPNGCEVVSLAIALREAGFPIQPGKLYDDYMPKGSFNDMDFVNTYVGNPRAEGLGCYAPCVVETGNAYINEFGSDKKVRDISGTSMEDMKAFIDIGIPVVVWGTLDMRPINSPCATMKTEDGEKLTWNACSHCMVLIGYSDDTYIFCDPLSGVEEYDKEDVEESYAIAYSQACVIY